MLSRAVFEVWLVYYVMVCNASRSPKSQKNALFHWQSLLAVPIDALWVI